MFDGFGFGLQVPSFIFPLENLHGIKIRLPGNAWSGLIPFATDCKSRGVLLVRGALAPPLSLFFFFFFFGQSSLVRNWKQKSCLS